MRKAPRYMFRCGFCRKVFIRALRSMYAEIKCPKCRETDVELIRQVREPATA